jgi:serine/threonine protein kinase
MAVDASETFGDVRIIDFGQSTRQHAYDGTDWHRGPHLGTRGFAPPEMFDPVHSTGRASRSTSSFSLGALAYFMMTGRRPFEKELEEERRTHERTVQAASPATLDAEARRYYAAVAEIERAAMPIGDRVLAMLARDASLRELLLLADWCTHPWTHARPIMDEAIWALESMLGISEGRPSPTPTGRIDALLDYAFATYTRMGDTKSNLRRTAALAHYCGLAGSDEARLLAANALELLGETEFTDSLAVGNYRAAADGGSVAAKNSLRRLGKTNQKL